MGLRTLLIILGAWIIFLAVRNYLSRKNFSGRKNTTRPMVKTVKCDYCGTHFPVAEAIKNERGTFCCQEHADKNIP